MTASVANGFAQVNFDPTASTCTQTPYAFHPMYSTSSEHTRVPWAAHSYNVAFSDEIGHFEYCDHANVHGKCVNPTNGDNNKKDGDDISCFNADESLRILIGGCIATDNDFDGVSYQKTWPGSLTDPALDAAAQPASILFTSPTFNGGLNYSSSRLRGRSATDRGRRLRWHLQPDDRSRLRQPAAWLEFLSVLHHPGERIGGLLLAARRGEHPRARPTRSAGTRRRPSARCSSWTTRWRASRPATVRTISGTSSPAIPVRAPSATGAVTLGRRHRRRPCSFVGGRSTPRAQP